MAEKKTRLIYLSLGSNLNPEENMRKALEILKERCQVIRISSIWSGPAVGASAPDFLNAAACVRSDLEQNEFKTSIIRPLEQQLGRVRTADKFAPRTIDVDIILFGDQVIDEDLWRFAHLAVPIAEIYPDELHAPDGRSLKAIAEELGSQNKIVKI